MFKTIIEVEAFGDFDSYTFCIMVSTEEKSVDDIIKDFCVYMDIPSIKGLPYNKLYDMTEAFVSYLEMIGFSKLETTKVNMSD